MCNARTLCASSSAAASLLPIQPRTTASMAFVAAPIGLTAAPCSPHVGLTCSDSVIKRAAASSAFARSFMAALGLSSAIFSVSFISAFLHSSATAWQMLRKSFARVAAVLSIAQRMSKRRFWMRDPSPGHAGGRWPSTNADSSRPSEDAASECTAKLPSLPPAAMMASPTCS